MMPFLEKMVQPEKPVLDVTFNIAHIPVFDQDLMINAEFVKRLADNPPTDAEKGGKK